MKNHYPMNSQDQIILIDGSSFIFRAFYALPNLTSPNQVPTGAVYGVLNMIQQMQKKFNAKYWACIFDAKGKTFRDEIYPEYKANRRETPPELIPQFSIIHELVALLGIEVIIYEGVEADDVIGTIAQQFKQKNVLIATGDKDFAQLVDSNIHLINTMTNEYLDENKIIEKFGVKPSQITDYLALVGDNVDNVPGVHKCGPKTAIKWLEKYQNLENIINHKDEITGSVGINLAKVTDWLPTAKHLVTIKCDIPIDEILPYGINQLQIKPQNTTKLLEWFNKLGFKTWAKQLNNDNITRQQQTEQIPPKKPNKVANNIIINSANDLNNHIINLKHPSIMIINEEYQNYNSNISCIIINSNNNNLIITQKNSTDLLDTQDNITDYKDALQNLFGNKNLTLVTANFKQMLYNLKQLNISIGCKVYDIITAHYILESQKPHTISNIYHDELNIQIKNLEELYKINGKLSKWSLIESQTKIDELAKIMDNMAEVHHSIINKLTPEEQNIYYQLELPLTPILYNIEISGIKIDRHQFGILNHQLSSKIKQLEELIYQQANCVFNINSSKQLQDVLFNQMKLPTFGISKNTNGYSTNEESLSILAENGFSIANLLLEYRTLTKLLNTYVEKLPKLTDKNDRLHTTLEQTVVASGRLSSKDPNLQNIPVRNEWGSKIRSCFIAKENHQLICADYSQIELRILAHISNDTNMINAFLNGADIHSITASEIFNKPLHNITKDERRYAKSINFGLIYGKTIFGLSKELNISREESKRYIDAYFAKYPQIKQFMDNIKLQAHQNGYVKTLLGRKIYLPNINSSNKIVTNAEERLALNAPMQGTAADIIKIAMNNITKWLQDQKLNTKLILQIHDELILEAPINEIDIIKANITNLMTKNIMQLNVPLEIDVKVADNWDKAH